MKRALICLVAVLFTASVAKAGSILSGTLTVDNGFVAYLSTSPVVAGTPIAAGASWQSAVAIAPTQLTWGTTYYLQIAAVNLPDGTGPNPIFDPAYAAYQWGAILGQFSINNNFFQFSNSTQNLLTNTTDWTYSQSGFGISPLTPASQGNNGVTPWGAVGGISSSAQWIWDPIINYGPDLWFETEITPTPGVTPEPGSLFLLGSGLTALAGFIARRRSA